MTKKHYEAIAAIVKTEMIGSLQAGIRNEPIKYIAHNLADYFATDNPKFNRTRFLQACGIEQSQT